MIKHKHHIIPKHAGGSNDPSNLIELTPEEHAEAHKLLWEEHGRWQDYIAWQGLAKRMSCEEIIREKARLANTGRVPRHKGKKTGPRPNEVRKLISETMRARKISPTRETIERGLAAAHEARRGTTVTDEQRAAISAGLKEYNKNNPRPFRPRSDAAKTKTAASKSKSCTFKGVVYPSLKKCREVTGLTRHWIVNDSSFKWM